MNFYTVHHKTSIEESLFGRSIKKNLHIQFIRVLQRYPVIRETFLDIIDSFSHHLQTKLKSSTKNK